MTDLQKRLASALREIVGDPADERFNNYDCLCDRDGNPLTITRGMVEDARAALALHDASASAQGDWSDTVPVPKVVIAFLNGQSDWDGTWFGEMRDGPSHFGLSEEHVRRSSQASDDAVQDALGLPRRTPTPPQSSPAVAPKELGAVAWEVHGCGNLLAVYPTPPELIPRGYLWGFDSESEAHLLCRALNKLKLYTHPSPWRERLMGLADEWDGRGKHLIESQATIYDYVAHELREVIESLAAQP
jgi:hypothetical protein